jgi:hypothetical protein
MDRAGRQDEGRQRPHGPLCDDAVALLKALPRHAETNLLFPSPRMGQLSDMSISAVMKRMNVDAVPHGFPIHLPGLVQRVHQLPA